MRGMPVSGVRRLLVLFAAMAGLMLLGLPNAGASAAPAAGRLAASAGLTGLERTGSPPPALKPDSGGDQPLASMSADSDVGQKPSRQRVSDESEDTTLPDPTVTADFSSVPVINSDVSFTITSNDPSTDPATEFVLGLENPPPTFGPPADQVISLPSGQTSTTVTIQVSTPGPNELYAYAIDAAGDESQTSELEFFVAGDPDVTYSSFADALAAGQSFDNTMISSSSSDSGTADADGAGDSFDSAELQAAGWKPDGAVTIDGATFTLPDFGSGAPDNILAANQTIDMPPGAQGTSLVFLVTGSNANATAAEEPNYEALDTAPSVPGGSAVVDANCTPSQYGSDDQSCIPASGVINYVSGSSAFQQGYSLSVPDWIAGPAGPAAIEFPGLATATGITGDNPKIYAFSVPLNPSAPVASVSLPDVGATLTAIGGSARIANLHVLGIAVANTTTATPGSDAGLASGHTWTAAWASPTEGAFAPPSRDGASFSDQTFRITMRASAGGSAVRLRLSDDLGWLAGKSGRPLDIGDVTVAAQGTGASVTGKPVATTFDGSRSVTIPEGGDVYSDPVDLAVTPGESLTVSIYLENSVPYLVEHSWCSACAEYVTPSGAGDETGNVNGTPFSGPRTIEGEFTNVLTGVDVQTSGTPAVAVLGDGLIDASGKGTTAVPHGTRISDDLSAELQAAAGAGNEPAFGVIGEGIESNQVLTDTDTTTGIGGPSALSRIASDILAEPGVGTVIVDEGLEDVLRASASSTTGLDLDNGYSALSSQLNAWGITVIFGTLTPCAGYAGSGRPPEDACTTAVDSVRVSVNSDYLLGNYGNSPCLLTPCVTALNFDSAVSDGGSPEALQPAYNSGDNVNLTDAGYAAITAAIPLSDLMPNTRGEIYISANGLPRRTSRMQFL
jgi:hypothetical protein